MYAGRHLHCSCAHGFLYCEDGTLLNTHCENLKSFLYCVRSGLEFCLYSLIIQWQQNIVWKIIILEGSWYAILISIAVHRTKQVVLMTGASRKDLNLSTGMSCLLYQSNMIYPDMLDMSVVSSAWIDTKLAFWTSSMFACALHTHNPAVHFKFILCVL
jgi:hypothetical protein